MKKIIALSLSIALAACGGGDVYASGVSSVSNYNPSAVAITGGTINGITALSITKLLFSATAPTIASGFGTTPYITPLNGTALFYINVGGGGAANGGVVTMPAATAGWVCNVIPWSAPTPNQVTYALSSTRTSLHFQNYAVSTGAVAAWPSGYSMVVSCVGY